MNARTARPNVNAVLDGLKDFQRASVDTVFRRLYLAADSTRRFLVADEVGLGKTLVARGVIARTVDYLWSTTKRIDVVYVCSNADIARQNIQRLKIGEQTHFGLATRITLLPTVLADLQERKLNFVSFTPGTSFNLRSQMGVAEERALLYELLRRAWQLRGRGPIRVLQGDASFDSFEQTIQKVKTKRHIDRSLRSAFLTDLELHIDKQRAHGETDIRARFEGLSQRLGRSRRTLSAEDRRERAEIVGDLRRLLAKSCIKALEPDLIILDEFQRFKHLIDGNDEMSELAHDLFSYEGARILLLSATPYKMYTLAHETDDDHYADFLRTLAFLLGDESETAHFRILLQEFRREVLRLGEHASTSPAEVQNGHLARLKAELERRLRRVIVRTERLAVTEDRDGMLEQVQTAGAQLEASDLVAYARLQATARVLDQRDTLEYWKSAPYLLNFMDDYDLKRKFERTCQDPRQARSLARTLGVADGLLLSWADLAAYREIDPANARLRTLLADTIESGAWRLLWMPPTLPYYQLGGAFADPAVRRFTKRLVFSSWKVAPKAIAALVSYAAEREMMQSFEEAPENTSEARRRRRGLLRFARTDDRLVGMAVLGMLYPCMTIARECDPLALIGQRGTGDTLPTVADILDHAERRIDELLPSIRLEPSVDGPEDEAWYWAAPILLDLFNDGPATRMWFGRSRLAQSWVGETVDDDDVGGEDRSSWAEHVDRARALIVDPQRQLGPRPRDLARVLALMAVAGPGVAALRALSRVAGGPGALSTPTMRDRAGQIAWSLRNLFNLPEVMSLLRPPAHSSSNEQNDLNASAIPDRFRESGREEPYWRLVLEYCVDGGLQPALDEFAHVLRESLGLLDQKTDSVASQVAEAISHALSLRAATPVVDEISVDGRGDQVNVGKNRGMRNRFAMRFGDERQEESGGTGRADHVRAAFNSPFWPFVLATTSVGQEGLDFHPYCHAVVHWNLPSNPVDLEQREGRVHRYKGHAVRKNLARQYGVPETSNNADPWESLFACAVHDRPDGATDLVPFWVYPREGGAKIERHVPALPMSRDLERLTALRKSLAVYRMVFGQPRQDDLVKYVLAHVPESEIAQITNDLRIDLSPRDTNGSSPTSHDCRTVPT
jgi:hypothetical protein